jgi:hypothetical protein
MLKHSSLYQSQYKFFKRSLNVYVFAKCEKRMRKYILTELTTSVIKLLLKVYKEEENQLTSRPFFPGLPGKPFSPFTVGPTSPRSPCIPISPGSPCKPSIPGKPNGLNDLN